MVEVRELTVEDAGSFRDLRLLGLRESPSAFGASPSQEAALGIDDFERRLRGTRDRWVLGALSNEVLVGVVGFAREESEKMRHRGYVWGMYVDPNWRRRGVGRMLLSAALKRVDALEGLQSLRLGVTASNEEAQRLYESLGFERLYVEDDYLVVDGASHSMLFMRRRTGSPRGR